MVRSSGDRGGALASGCLRAPRATTRINRPEPATRRRHGPAISLRCGPADFCDRVPSGATAARHFVLRFARERGAPNEFPGHRARGSVGGTLVGSEPAVWLCVRSAAPPFLEWDDVRISNAALVYSDA